MTASAECPVCHEPAGEITPGCPRGCDPVHGVRRHWSFSIGADETRGVWFRCSCMTDAEAAQCQHLDRAGVELLAAEHALIRAAVPPC